VHTVAEHPEAVEKGHVAKIPTVHRWEFVQRHVERADRRRVIDDREAEPHEEARAILDHREDRDAPVLLVDRETHP